MKTKRCPKCELVLDVSAFGRDKSRKDCLRWCCKRCHAASSANFRINNPEKARTIQATYRTNNRDKVNARSAVYRANKPEKARAATARWRTRNPENQRPARRAWVASNIKKVRAIRRASEARRRASNPELMRSIGRDYEARHRARKLQAMPAWLTPSHKAITASMHAAAARKTRETGIPHHVDHIIPLNGKTVSGLHVPWNMRVITAVENLRKSNKLESS